ncbi:Uncharacterised protein [Pseudomonas fluorescens]|uniref:Uncharacterized protein n=1 Tax=Pseudomonas fluorescens TaxID=294 RepID=A0A448DPY6_PSEFL|nr:Uncharacterised protein [Pseudomonas fluorescens]
MLLGGVGGYPVFRVWLIAVPPLRRVTFSRRRKSNQKGLLLRSALAGSGSFAAGSIRAQRLRFASLHLLSLCSTSSNGRCAPTPGSIPPLSLPTSPVDQGQERDASLRSLLSGAASPRAAALLFRRRRPDSRPEFGGLLAHVGAAAGCDLLILLFFPVGASLLRAAIRPGRPDSRPAFLDAVDPNVGAAAGCDLLILLFFPVGASLLRAAIRPGRPDSRPAFLDAVDPNVGAAAGCDLLILLCFPVEASLRCSSFEVSWRF